MLGLSFRTHASFRVGRSTRKQRFGYKGGYKLSVAVTRVEPPATDEKTEADYLFDEARFELRKSTLQSVRSAITLFQNALTIDPNHTASYVGLANSWVLAGSFGHQSYEAGVAMDAAENAANEAVRLDPNSGEAYASLASIDALYRWNWAKANRKFQKAMKLSSEPMICAWYSLCLAARGEHAKAQHYIEEAIHRNRDNFILKTLRARVYYLARDYARAESEALRAIALHEHFYLAHLFFGHALRQQGRLLEASNAFALGLRLGNEHPTALAELGHIQAKLGRYKVAYKCLDKLAERQKAHYISPHHFFHINLGLGNVNMAFEYLQKTCDERGAYLIYLM